MHTIKTHHLLLQIIRKKILQMNKKGVINSPTANLVNMSRLDLRSTIKHVQSPKFFLGSGMQSSKLHIRSVPPTAVGNCQRKETVTWRR